MLSSYAKFSQQMMAENQTTTNKPPAHVSSTPDKNSKAHRKQDKTCAASSEGKGYAII